MSQARQILALAVPAFAALVAHPLMLLADTWIAARLGTAALAGLGIGSGVLLTVVGLCVFLAYGSTAVVARRLGAGNRQGGLTSGVQAMWLAAALGVALVLLTWPLSEPLAAALGARGEVLDQAVTYLRYALPGLPGMLVLLAATGTFRGLADARTPLVLAVTAAGLNFVLNLALVFGAGLGLAGAALGTALAETAVGIGAAGLVSRSAHRAGARLQPSWSQMRAALAVGAALWLRTAALRTALLLTTYVAAAQGATALAAHHIVMNIWGLLAYALDALAIAGQTIIATALGAGDATRAQTASRLMVRWSVSVGLVLGLTALAARDLIAAFFSPDPGVQHQVAWLLVIVGVTLGLAGFVYLLDGVLIGAGDANFLAWASLVTLAGYAPLALGVLLLPQGLLGLMWLWLAFTVGFMGLRAITLGVRARGGRWLRLGE